MKPHRATHPQELHQMCGEPGDIILMHPWCIHTCSQNFAEVPRVMANAAVRFKHGTFLDFRAHS
jgi:ectoine hydroxylase-related dioxygenase (phytanoyl-CoA dioxygenase family)